MKIMSLQVSLGKSDEMMYKEFYRDFPGGTVLKNPPANAGDMGWVSGPGRSHMPRSN